MHHALHIASAPSNVPLSHTPSLIAPLRIGVLIPNLQLGGAERVCVLLADAWLKRGHRVTVMTLGGVEQDAYTLPARATRLVLGHDQTASGLWPALKKNLKRVARLRREMQDFDVVLSFLTETNVCLAVAGRGGDTACVAAERTYPPAVPLGRVRAAARRWSFRWLDEAVAQTADVARWLQDNTQAPAVSAVPNPVALPLWRQAPLLDPAHWLPENAPMVLAAGRLASEKQFDQLITAFVQASSAGQQHPLWRLVIVGDGPLRANLQAHIDALGATSRVLLPGRCGNMGDWMGRASAFAMTSAFEGYPNALLEALASGVPAVAYDCPTGPRALIRHGENGLLVPSGDVDELSSALKILMTQPGLRARLATLALHTADTHAPAWIASQWETVFQRAIARRRDRGQHKRNPLHSEQTA